MEYHHSRGEGWQGMEKISLLVWTTWSVNASGTAELSTKMNKEMQTIITLGGL